MIDELTNLLNTQTTELIGANAPGIAEELKNSDDGLLSIALSFKLSLIGSKVCVKTGIGYARKFKDSTEGVVEIPDPNQPELPAIEPDEEERPRVKCGGK